MIVMQCIVSLAIFVFVTYFFGSLYYEVTKRLGITNCIEVCREIIGWYILGGVLWFERRMEYVG